MTDQQKRLVVDNIALAYHVAGQGTRWYGIEYDEALSATQYGLVKAAICFEPERGTRFSTLACLMMRQEIQRELQKKWYCMEKVSLDVEIPGTDNLVVGDQISDFEEYFDMTETVYDMKKRMVNLKHREKEAVILKITHPGRTQVEYSRLMGVSQSLYSRYLKAARKKLVG